MADSPVLVCLPANEERLNFSTTTQIAIPVDHFDSGFKFPLLWEIAEIFEHYRIVPSHLAPNTLDAIYSFISYLRSEKITFSLNIFRKIFSVRSITPFGGCLYMGIINFYCRGMKFMGLSNKIHNCTSRFLIFEGELRFAHTYPQESARNAIKGISLDAMESVIVEFLVGARLDIEHYILLLASLGNVTHEGSKFCGLTFVSAATYI
ncbi:hypothetical protein KSP40_PGU000122 [Platanthera guangdongensis]|uniref:Transposase (putative) gypsy type domain-containing protein n=1 Tax=Platanthera guangdongensis TaxID=2320717 RepID=A0ABR2LWJ1_9ASPA